MQDIGRYTQEFEIHNQDAHSCRPAFGTYIQDVIIYTQEFERDTQ